MKYKQMDFYKSHPELPRNDIMHSILTARGVEDVYKLMNVSRKDVLDPFLLMNMKKGIKLLDKHVENGSRIVILIDLDSDGFTSASAMYNYMKKNFGKFGIELEYIANRDKAHGIVIDRLEEVYPNWDFDLLIVPDAGANDRKQTKILKSKGIDVLILDHHPTNTRMSNAIMINPNQKNCPYPNKDLSGVGVVYKFCQALDTIYGFADADSYLDLVSVGLTGDSMDLRSYETRYLALEGIKMMEQAKDLFEQGLKPDFGNPLLNTFVKEKMDYDLKNINFHSLAWKVIPLINSCVRSGTDEEKRNMFKAFIGQGEPVMFQPRRPNGSDKKAPKPDMIELSFAESTLKMLGTIKGRQTKELKVVMELIDAKVIEGNLAEDKIIFVDGTGLIENKSLSGLVAQKIASKYMKPTIILKERNKSNFGGSGRNYSSMSVVENFKDLLVSTGVFNKDQAELGHQGAFGCHIKKSNVPKAKKILAEMLKDTEFDLVYPVDFIIPIGRLDKKIVLEVGKLKSVWGTTLPAPRFAITDVTVDVSNIEVVGEKANMLRIKKGDFTFIKFFSNTAEADAMRMRNVTGFGSSPKVVIMDIIVEMSINEFNGNEYPEMIIVDWNSRKVEEILF